MVGPWVEDSQVVLAVAVAQTVATVAVVQAAVYLYVDHCLAVAGH